MVSKIMENVSLVLERIRRAAERAARDPAGVRLVAVTKTRTVEEIEAVLAAGIRDLGENRVQELRSKAPFLQDRQPTWHLIGTLQTNKVKQALEWAELIHSLDRSALLSELVKQAERRGRPVDALVQVNVSGEASKHGLPPGDLEPFLRQVAQQRWVRVRGLMTMAPLSDNPEDARPHFRRLRQLRDQMQALGIEGVSLEHLSMGMSGDYEVAVEEGATLVRVGTAIFGPRD
ncbi:YggS family pyridoxal phosphate-dependent enzyme [Symbiobacterium thermophilum]|nr:YggS family pyridoxal phosphate-dependent enzyme [Symbiobacterium thermophilum]